MIGFVVSAVLIVVAHGGRDSNIARQRVDLIELNHSLDDSGRHAFDQLIFYVWSEPAASYRVIAWRMIKRPEQVPTRTWDPMGYRCVWQDEGILREIWAPAFRESWTQTDPERENRKQFSEDKRPGLAVPWAMKADRFRRF